MIGAEVDALYREAIQASPEVHPDVVAALTLGAIAGLDSSDEQLGVAARAVLRAADEVRAEQRAAVRRTADRLRRELEGVL